MDYNDTVMYGSDAYITNEQPWDFVFDNYDYSALSAAPYETTGEYVYTDVSHTLIDASIINQIFDAGFRPEDLGYYIVPESEIVYA